MAKEVNIDLVKEVYADLKAQEQTAIEIALLNKSAIVQERIQAETERIDQEVERDLIEEARKPFAEKIALVESFLVDVQPEEEKVDAENETAQEQEALEVE